MLGTDHDWPPESRPRIAAAWVLHEATNSNTYTVVVAVRVKQIASWGRPYEHSTSAEEQDVSMALVVTREFMDDLSEVLLCSDSQAMLHAMAKTCIREHVSALRPCVPKKVPSSRRPGAKWRPRKRRGRSDSDVISIWRLYLPGVEPGISRLSLYIFPPHTVRPSI